MSLLSRLAVQAARAYGILSSADKTKVAASYLVVAGGGGGGAYEGAGGGAGGYQTSTFTLSTLNTYSITVGAGGISAGSTSGAGNNGSNSVVSGTGLTTITSVGGGGGGGLASQAGKNGGSGGGASSNSTTVGLATSGQGNNGGLGTGVPGAGTGGGGGGAGEAGNTDGASYGGDGLASSISGTSTYYAGGGAGYSGSGPQGGLGGGGNLSTAGTANTGGGGGAWDGVTPAGNGGSGVVIISYASASPKFVGGTLTTSGGNQIHTFTSSGTLSPLTPVTASYLVVAGGGGGGQGGGGAGGLQTSSTTLYSGASYIVTVGAGGTAGTNQAAGSNGSNSVVSGTGLTTITSTGGGRGGYFSAVAGASGGSGGGGGGSDAGGGIGAGGSGTSGQGNSGGSGVSINTTNGGGGGGGAGAAGGNAVATSNGGAGGIGLTSSISGTSTYYAGGGSGGCSIATAGGQGGGGAGGAASSAGSPGTTNTGGGGGGGGNTTGGVAGGAGGSGIVIISYAGSQVFNGGLVTSSGGNTIHTFTATGALTPLTNNLNNSLRFRSSASAFLNRTPTLTGNRQKFTISTWIKRGTLSTEQAIITQGSGNRDIVRIGPDNQLYFYWYDTGTTNYYPVNTTQVFRDPSAWYHIVINCDTTQATAANRIKLYVNGNQVTALSNAVYPSQNFNFIYWNTTNAIAIGKDIVANNAHLDGYLADFNFIDGEQLEPYYFGNNDANGVWKPIKYTGMYGTNGFYLTFGNTTSTTTLGYDSSPNGNNWTTNNISLTAGTTYDAMLDVPTNTSATVANFPVYDQLTPSKVSGSGVRSISAGNLYVTNSGPNGWSAIGTTMVMTSGSGKWYWEVTCSGTTSNGSMIGIHRPFTSTSTFPSEILGYTGDADGYGYYMGGNKYNNSGAGVAYGASYTAGDVIGVALDMSTAGSASITFYKNNTSQGVAFSSLTGDFFAAVSQAQANGLDINFGQRPFSYTPPTGFVALNTYNLPTPTILQGNKYMDATLYTGNGSTQTIVNAGQFKPDFVWIKRRDGSGQDHVLQDSNRGFGGTTKLASSSTAAENTTGGATGSEWGFVTAANSNGFNITASTNGDQVNKNTWTYAGWQWQAGQGSTSSNTQGSITSTVSVNTTAGFSIVTYTGNGAIGATVGHGLGVAPSMIILKRRTGATASWLVWHRSLSNLNNNYLLLDTTNAQLSSTNIWGTQTSSVIALDTDSLVNEQNANGSTFVAYCWAAIAGYSAFGSYTGNGSTDGPFVSTNFAPKFVLIKRTDISGEDWAIYDTSRATYNVVNNVLVPNLSSAEISGITGPDILSNGFKLRDTNAGRNASGGNYIFMAFASNPFKSSNSR